MRWTLPDWLNLCIHSLQEVGQLLDVEKYPLGMMCTMSVHRCARTEAAMDQAYLANAWDLRHHVSQVIW